LLTKPSAKGRDYIISTSDEFFGDEFDPSGTAAPPDAPFHVIGVRTHSAKFATYNYWTLGTTNINSSQKQELELYDSAFGISCSEADVESILWTGIRCLSLRVC
jgi:hypothetical protein